MSYSIRSGALRLVAIAVLGTGFSGANALPLGGTQSDGLNRVPWISSELQGLIDFSAIVGLDDCSGSLVRFENSHDSDSGLVLTNGHCFEGGFLNPGEVKTDIASTRTFTLLKPDGRGTLGTLTARRVVYATMTNTDVTVYELNQSYAAITQQYGTTALTLSSKHPEEKEAIAVVSGYWRKIYSCGIDAFIYALREADWTFKDSLRYSSPGCETIGGTSGSPVIDTSTYQVVGINNTGNDNGERCTEDNPCEVDDQGNVTVHYKASYGQETYLFYGCLDSNSQIDLTQPGCQLPKAASVKQVVSR